VTTDGRQARACWRTALPLQLEDAMRNPFGVMDVPDPNDAEVTQFAGGTAADAAVAPVYDVQDIMSDPQYQALESIVSLPDDDLGAVKMQNVMFRMLGTPGRIRWAGRRLGQDNESVFAEIGVSTERLAELRGNGVI